MFITGVSPVTMDDVTSGFNIGANISINHKFNNILGFTETEVSEMIDYYTEVGVFHLDKNETIELMKQWYDNYKFSVRAEETVFNTDMILYFMKEVIGDYMFPEDLIDENVRVDYGKLQHLVTVNNRLNGNFSQLEKILTDGYVVAELKKSFPQERLADRDNFVSLLFYFGLLTIEGRFRGLTKFVVPNRVIAKFMSNFITSGYTSACKVNMNAFDLANNIADMAYIGKWQPCIELMAKNISNSLTLRQLVEGERSVQALLMSQFDLGTPFIIHVEKEANGGFFDIALAPFLAQFSDMRYGYLIELKYLKVADKFDAEVEAEIVVKAKEQLDQYAADENLHKEWQLKPHGEITLKKLVLIFKGTELVHSSEYIK